ncbi:Soluble lytic murein transglycosylase precursor [Rickettsiales bacterium Ac37b]|nr:Soluble lytic murein transglycosylase precursor [Rickettsiales bacterium Ac37b]
MLHIVSIKLFYKYRFNRFLFILLIGNLVSNLNVVYASSLNQNKLDILAESLYLIECGKYQEAWGKAEYNKDTLISDIILWMQYKSGQGGAFNEIQNFITKKPYWPMQNRLIQTAETAIDTNVSPNTVVNWFKKHPPTTYHGMKMLLDAQSKLLGDNKVLTKQNKDIVNLVKKIWLESNLSAIQERDFLAKYSMILNNQDHIKRVNELLWKNEFAQAERLLPKLSPDYQKFFLLRIKLLKKIHIPQNSMKHLPPKLRFDPGLIYAMAHFHHHKDDIKNVVQLLSIHPSSNENKKQWWSLRSRYIRELLYVKDYHNAYKIAKNHHHDGRCSEVDAEWLAGWIALKFLNNPEQASRHFYTFYNNVKFPISLARGAYWSAIAYTKLNDKQLAQEWYKIAASYPYTFYGQLALLKLGHNTITLPKEIVRNVKGTINTSNIELLNVFDLFFKLKKLELAKMFAEAAILNSKTQGEAKLIVDHIYKTQNLYLIVEITKLANREKLLFVKSSYPVLPKLANFDLEKPIIHSIIRQESVFNKDAKSTAGALGMMQLMPSTAQKVAKNLSVKYSKVDLTANPSYNIKLGSNHLYSLLKDYKGSYILAIAAYNAGSANVDKWINTIGDPRNINKLDDLIDWMEMVPFYETRNYLQRVIENLQVYRVIMNGNGLAARLTVDKDLMRLMKTVDN